MAHTDIIDRMCFYYGRYIDLSDVRLIDADRVSRVLREVENRLFKSGNYTAEGAVRAVRKHIYDFPTVEAVPREEFDCLLRRFRHLLESDYIRSFDEVDHRTGEYKRDIREANEQMTINDYQVEALRTAHGMSHDLPMWLNGALGLNGEAGEVADVVKKHLFQGHPIDFEHMAKELGDVAWYVAVTAHAIGYDLETILQMNVDKLRKRYPNGFEAERSLHRQEGDV